MEFSSSPPTVMHVDINSCFATIEQQANPRLRGRPVVVAAYVEPHGCILAASVEAKRLGIKTGMRVREGRDLCKQLVVLAPDPEKYRFVNRKMRALLESYTPYVSVESIDEMVLNLNGSPELDRHVKAVSASTVMAMGAIGKEIKARITSEIGEWITVSIGIAPNRYLAKVASGLHKPDGLDVIDKYTIEDIFFRMKLEDLCGIKEGNATRLRASGITTPLAMLFAPPKQLKYAFRSIVGFHWWMRLHGYEDGSRYKAFGSPEGGTSFAGGSGGPQQKSFGQSHALGIPRTPDDPRLWQILSQLVMKMARRMRRDMFTASGISVSLLFADHSHWGLQHKVASRLFADVDFYYWARRLLLGAPIRSVRILAVSCFDLASDLYDQQSLFVEENRKKNLTQAIDAIQDRFGDFVISSGRMLRAEQKVLDRIAFGRIRELQK